VRRWPSPPGWSVARRCRRRRAHPARPRTTSWWVLTAAAQRRAAFLAVHPGTVTRQATLYRPFLQVAVPTRIVIGARHAEVPIAANLDSPQAAYEAAVQVFDENSGWGVGTSVIEDAATDKMRLTLDLEPAVFGYGPGNPIPLGTGEIDLYAMPSLDARQFSFLSVPTVVRAHSLLGLAAVRAGDLVTITTSARAYDIPKDAYLPWHRRSIVVQRWTSTGWATLTVLPTDLSGNSTTTLRIPFAVGLRAVVADSGQIWGATSASVAR